MRKRPLQVAQRAIDVALGAVPGSFVEKVTSATAPLTRYSGRSRAGAATLSSALSALAQPPRQRRRREALMSLDEIAAEVGYTTQEVERWAEAGYLGAPVEGDAWDGTALDRAALLAMAVRRGISEAEVEQAVREGRLPLLVLESALAGEARLSGRTVADRSGVPLDTAVSLWRALGLPVGDLDEPLFTRHEVYALRTLGALRSVFTDDDLIESASVVGRAMAEVSAAAIELFRRRLTAPYIEAGLDELAVSLRLAAIADLLVPPLGPLLEAVLRRHLALATSAETALRISESGAMELHQPELSVAFADLVGFTAASQQMSALEVAELVSHLLHAAERALAPRGARIVKTIGDAVMFTARDPVTCCLAALDLVEASARDELLPAVRVGIAHGPVMRAYADYFGRTVNIAARLCDAAHAGDVLLHLGKLSIDDAAWHTAGLGVKDGAVMKLKGFDQRLSVVHVSRLR